MSEPQRWAWGWPLGLFIPMWAQWINLFFLLFTTVLALYVGGWPWLVEAQVVILSHLVSMTSYPAHKLPKQRIWLWTPGLFAAEANPEGLTLEAICKHDAWHLKQKPHVEVRSGQHLCVSISAFKAHPRASIQRLSICSSLLTCLVAFGPHAQPGH